MHWTYKLPEHIENLDLEQGDIIRLNEHLKSNVFQRYHPYYLENTENQFFIILTQSCDLVQRNNKCKSQYIALAPVRSLRNVILKEFNGSLLNNEIGAQAYGSNRIKKNIEDFLSKLINNNESNYFYLKKQPDKNISDDMCAILNLSISIKAEHYDECKKSRFLQLDDLFQAKLGWLVGQRYSRVGTRDWEQDTLNQEIKGHIEKTAIWFDDESIKSINAKIIDEKAENPKAIFDRKKLIEMSSSITTKKQKAIDVIFQILIDEKILTEEPNIVKSKLRQKIDNNPNFSSFFKK